MRRSQQRPPQKDRDIITRSRIFHVNRPEEIEVEGEGKNAVIRISAARDVRTTTYRETADGQCFIEEQALDLPTVLPLERGGWSGGAESGDVAALRAAQQSPQAAREYMLSQGESAGSLGQRSAPGGYSSAELKDRYRRLDKVRAMALSW